MAAVYKKTVTKALPKGAETFSRKGERFARWKDARGKTRTAPLTTGRDGSNRIVITAGTYTAKYRGGEGVVREVATGCRSKDGAMSVLKDLTDRAEKVKSRILTPAEDRISDHQDTPLGVHITAYIDHQTAKGLNKTRIANNRSRLNRLAADCSFRSLSDLSATALERWLADRKSEGMSAGNRNEFRQTLVGFGNWCVRTSRICANPLCFVAKADTKADQRRKRRAMTEAELTKLLDATRRRPLLDAMTIRRGKHKGEAIANLRPETKSRLKLLGQERALLYKTYLLTGLRKSELASLTAGQLELDAPAAFAVLDAADEKNREGSTIAIRGDLAGELREWLHVKLTALQDDSRQRGVLIPDRLPADSPVFDVPTGLVRILDRDLKLAGIPKCDDRGRTIDIHALRHTFGTHLSKAGVAPRTAQAAMRHSTIDLTMNVYTDPRLLDVHGALESLPALSLDTEQTHMQRAVKATGTDDLTALPFAPGFAPTTGNRSESQSTGDNLDRKRSRHEQDSLGVVSLASVNGKRPLSSADNGRHQVEPKGVEPSTSALRTQRSPK